MDYHNIQDLPELITIKEAATYLKVSKFTIKRWLIAGKLNGIKLPNSHWRVFLSS